LGLIFPPDKDRWINLLPFGRIEIIPGALDTGKRIRPTPIAIFRPISRQYPEDPIMVLAGPFVQIHFPDQQLRLSPPDEEPRVEVLYPDSDPLLLPLGEWTRLPSSGSILRVTPPGSDGSWTIKSFYGEARFKTTGEKRFIINKVKIPPLGWEPDLLKILRENPRNLKGIFHFLTGWRPFENSFQFAPWEQKKEIIALFDQ